MQETLVQSLGQEDHLEKGMATHSSLLGLPLVTHMAKNQPAMRETWVQSLGWEDHRCSEVPEEPLYLEEIQKNF